MEHLQTQLSEAEEAVLELMKRVTKLETENENLREENKRLKWTLQEHD
jgi:regulator of replication initiation timing